MLLVLTRSVGFGTMQAPSNGRSISHSSTNPYNPLEEPYCSTIRWMRMADIDGGYLVSVRLCQEFAKTAINKKNTK